MSSNQTDDKTEKALNGVETDSEHPANEGTNEEEEAVINTCYYDKSKSFFDNLSCDDPRYHIMFLFFLFVCLRLIVTLCQKIHRCVLVQLPFKKIRYILKSHQTYGSILQETFALLTQC